MSFALKKPVLAALKSYRVSNVNNLLASSRCLGISRSVRHYTQKGDNKKYKSILDDDLLEKTGINTDKATSKDSSVGDMLKEEKQKLKHEAQNIHQAEKEEGKKIEEEFSGKDTNDEFSRAKERRNNTKSTLDKKKERYENLFWWFVLGGTLAFGGYMMRNWDEKKEPELYVAEENGYSPLKMLKRLRKRFSGVSGVLTEPAFNDLLPPPPPEPYRHPLTLVLELDDTLVHSAWDHAKGWRTAKRPGVDYFLGYLSQYYEIVVFSKSSMAFAENTISKLDPYHAFISYSLFKEVCRTKDGKIVKDLSMMNRPLEKMIMIDPDRDCASLQPENNIPLDKWNGKKDDKLIALIPFLEYVATQPVKDVRPILASFKDKKNIPTEFAWREHKLREEWNKQQKVKQENSFLSKILGIPPSLGFQSKMPLDAIREAGQKNYENMHKYLQENGDKMLKEEEQKTKEMLADQKLTLGKIVTEGMPTAEDIAKQQAQAAAAPADASGSKKV